MESDYVNNIFVEEEYQLMKQAKATKSDTNYFNWKTPYYFFTSSRSKENTQRDIWKLRLMPILSQLNFRFTFVDFGIFKPLIALIKPKIETNTFFKMNSDVLDKFLTTDNSNGFGWSILKNEIDWHSISKQMIESGIEFNEREIDELGIRVVSKFNLDIKGILQGQKTLTEVEKKQLQRIVIHYHGGAYLMLSSNHFLNYLVRLTKETNSTIFSVDYLLAPNFKTDQIFKSIQTSYVLINVN